MHKIAHLSSVHAPTDVRIFHKECSSLAKAGYEVVLIAPGTPAMAGIKNGVRIHCIEGKSNRFTRMLTTTFKVFQSALAEKADLYHFHDPELIPVGLVLQLIYGKHVVYDVHEDVPNQILSKHWIPEKLRQPISTAVQFFETWAIKNFSGVVTAISPDAPRFLKNKTVNVNNFPLLSEFGDAFKITEAIKGPFIGYVGGITTIRGAKEMLDVVDALAMKTPEIRLLLAGSFSPANLEQDMKSHPGWEHVDFFGQIDRKGIVELLSKLQVGLVTLHKVPNHGVTYPIKLFEFMAAGLPVVVTDFPMWSEVVENHKCGIAVDPLDIQKITQAVQYLLDNPNIAQEMGERGRKAVLANYNWSTEEQKLLALYKKLLNPHEVVKDT